MHELTGGTWNHHKMILPNNIDEYGITLKDQYFDLPGLSAVRFSFANPIEATKAQRNEQLGRQFFALSSQDIEDLYALIDEAVDRAWRSDEGWMLPTGNKFS